MIFSVHSEFFGTTFLPWSSCCFIWRTSFDSFFFKIQPCHEITRIKRGFKKEFIQWNENTCSLSNLMNIEIQRKMKYREMIKKDDVIRLSVYWHVILCRVRRNTCSRNTSFSIKDEIIFIKKFLLYNFHSDVPYKVKYPVHFQKNVLLFLLIFFSRY